jgi:hypothetical protein
MYKISIMKNLSSLVIAGLLPLAVSAQNNVCFTVEANPNSSDLALSSFTKYVDVFGCSIYAESTVPDEKVLHAAAIWAELIDNDEDGIVDDPALLAELIANQAMMPIFASDGNAAMTTFENNYNGNGVAAVLWQTEMNPSTPGYWGSDATVEEVMHTINGVGQVNIYPAAFDFSPNSSLLSAAMDVARGGQFLSIPNPYPSSAWYHYDDATCDYGCMAIEYLYWMLVTNMGILNDTPTCNGIANEWEPCSPALLQSMDVLGHALITNPTYKLPQNAPDGNYCPASLSVPENSLNGLKIYPNPSNEVLFVEGDGLITIMDSVGKQILSKQINAESKMIDVSSFAKGSYTIFLNGNSSVFIKD